MLCSKRHGSGRLEKQCACTPAGQGLKIALQPGNERAASSRLGTYYARLPDGGRSLFARGESAKRAELVSLQAWALPRVGGPCMLLWADSAWVCCSLCLGVPG